jgi:hypothetical protein
VRVCGDKVVDEGLTDFGHGPININSSSSRSRVAIVGVGELEQRLSRRLHCSLSQ